MRTRVSARYVRAFSRVVQGALLIVGGVSAASAQSTVTINQPTTQVVFGTVRGGTGWGAEFAKLCNKPLFVFDQEKDGWFEWAGGDWKGRGKDTPTITHPHFTGTGTFIVLNLAERTILIGGTRYAGELKKSMFTVMNYYMPKEGVLSMHCSANIGAGGDTALFFGLSGTGKTTLSADPHRALIGDDEHGWAPEGTFNYEGGCYAKVINLSPEGEPDIYRTTQMFGTILENVVLDDDTLTVKFEDQSITENTRASYPLDYIQNHVPGGRGGHPKNIVFLTADAFGVLPPIAKLTREQAMYYFLSGYTAKVAGTERGVTEPQATFSSCFGAVFLVWHPTKYADMLGRLIDEHGSNVWLVNTGWSGGAYGAGKRMKLSHTRAMVTAALSGKLDNAATTVDPVFGLSIPSEVACSGSVHSKFSAMESSSAVLLSVFTCASACTSATTRCAST